MSRLLTSALAAIMSTALIASPVIAKARTDVAVFVPEDWPNAQRLEFDQVPEYIEIGTKD